MHISQSLYREVTKNKDIHLGPAESMRSVVSYIGNSKKMFIISNSPFWFINMGMSHVVGPDWRDAFEVIICEALVITFRRTLNLWNFFDPLTGW